MTVKLARTLCASLFAVAALTICVASASAIPSSTRYAYWGDYSSSIHQTDVLTGNSSVLVNGTAGVNPNGVSIDRAQGRIYWVARTNSFLYSADLDGSDVQSTDMGSLIGESDGTAIDAKNRRIYWPNSNDQTIGWADLDDLSSHGTLNIGSAPINRPQGVAVDSVAGIVYWTNDATTTNEVGWARLDGSGTGGGLFPASNASAVGISVIPSLQTLFWVTYGGNQLLRGQTDGSSGPTAITFAPSGSLSGPGGTGYDAAMGRVWVSSYENSNLVTSDLDGSNAVTYSAGASPWGDIAFSGAGVLTAQNEPLSVASAGDVPGSALLKLTNTGDYPLEYYGQKPSAGSPLSVGGGCPSYIAIGESCDLTVIYTPGSEQAPFSDEITLKTDAGNFKFDINASRGPAVVDPKIKNLRAVKRCASRGAAGSISVGFNSATATPVTASIQRSSTRLRKTPKTCPSRAGNTDYVSKPIGKKTTRSFTSTAGQQTATLKQMFGTKKLSPGRYRVLLSYTDASGSTVRKGTWVWSLR